MSFLCGDNAGTKEVQTLTLTYVGTATDSIVINGITVSYASATDATTTATNAVTAINAQAELKGLVTASSALGVVTLNALTDGNIDTTVVTGATGSTIVVATCRIPDDCIDKNRYPLFMARSVLRELIESLPSTRSL